MYHQLVNVWRHLMSMLRQRERGREVTIGPQWKSPRYTCKRKETETMLNSHRFFSRFAAKRETTRANLCSTF